MRRTIASVTLVVPCFNEAAVVRAFHARAAQVGDTLASRGVAMTMLFVDDGSRDATWELLTDLSRQDARVQCLRLARNRGHQMAVTAGIDHAEGDMVVVIDADLQDPPEVVLEMLPLLEDGHDVVHAQRRVRRGESAFKLATARGFYWLLRRLATVDIVENAGDFRALSRPAVLTMRAFREPHRFLRGMSAALGFRQTILLYDRDARAAGETKYPLRKMVRLAADAIFSFSSTPIRAIVWCSLALWALSLVYLAWSAYAHFVLNATITGWTSVVFLLTFFTGLILMSIAVVGSYVGRIFEQGQDRPLYWIADACNLAASPATSVASSRERLLSERLLAATRLLDEGGHDRASPASHRTPTSAPSHAR
jgi:polyisoprenyl-phosphate glycosyltransferase